MGQEQSQESNEKTRGALSAFCCNSNLCNNDSNIDNRITEANRKHAYRNMMAENPKKRTETFQSMNTMQGSNPYSKKIETNEDFAK